MQIVEWRSDSNHLNPITYDLSLEATAQRFANELAQTLGDETVSYTHLTLPTNREV